VTRSDRERAQRISQYVDGLVVHRREEGLRPFSADDDEFCELTCLARVLNRIDLKAPAHFRDELAARLSTSREQPSLRHKSMHVSRWFSCLWARPIGVTAAGVRAAAALAAVAAAVVVLVSQFATPPTVSAAEILGRADAALADLVRPGQILYRCWKVTDRITDASGAVTIRESVNHEWMDGADFGRVAGRNERDGRTYLAYAGTRESGELRPRVYFAPGFSDEPRGLLSIEPSRREFHEALGQFGPGDREKLLMYLGRGYIFEPISGERRFNQLMLESGTETRAPLLRIMVSLQDEILPSGLLVYALRILDPARVRFRWKREGPPVAWLEHRKTVRYIARDTYLSLKSEDTFEMQDGRLVFSTRELLETRIVEPSAVTVDPFVVTVPEETPVRRQSASEQLAAVARVLRTLHGQNGNTSRGLAPTH
jgi:hypothetical protein